MLLYFATVKRTTIHTAIARIHAFTHTPRTHTHAQNMFTHFTNTDTHIYTHAHNRTARTRTYGTHTNDNACPSMLYSTHVVRIILSRMSSLTGLFPSLYRNNYYNLFYYNRGSGKTYTAFGPEGLLDAMGENGGTKRKGWRRYYINMYRIVIERQSFFVHTQGLVVCAASCVPPSSNARVSTRGYISFIL